MKKFFRIATVIVTVFIAAAFSFGVFAETSLNGMDEDIISIINSQLTEQELSVLTDESNYDPSFAGASLNGVPILRVHNSIYWKYSDKPLDELIAEAERYEDSISKYFYIVFDEEPYEIYVQNKDGAISIWKAALWPDDVRTFFTDIADLSGETVIDGKSCKIENIYCFDSTNSMGGATVYLRTDKGVFVKYYEDGRSEGVIFTEAEFRNAAADYYDYITSYEYNYNESGEGLSGTISLIEFLNSNSHGQAPETGSSLTPVYIVLIICAAALALFPAVFKMIRRA